jgi:hypothetical protein
MWVGVHGEAVATSSAPELAQIAEPDVLEELGEILLDCADVAAWLARLDSGVMNALCYPVGNGWIITVLPSFGSLCTSAMNELTRRRR